MSRLPTIWPPSMGSSKSATSRTKEIRHELDVTVGSRAIPTVQNQKIIGVVFIYLLRFSALASFKEIESSWNVTTTTSRGCGIIMTFWPTISKNRTYSLFNMKMKHMRLIIGFITGHCPDKGIASGNTIFFTLHNLCLY